MVIQHSLSAMNANRQFGLVNKKRSSDMEKLSSGFKINRAADDAAGLSISEKMRRQVRGLTQASENCQDGVSLVQTADGALDEMHANLQRMNELCVKAANGTLTNDERNSIQEEIDQLAAEINRICSDTEFNEIPLFSNPDKLVKINANNYNNVPMDETITVGGRTVTHAKAMDFSDIDSTNIGQLDGKSFTASCSMGCSQVFNFKFSTTEADSATLDSAIVSNPGITVVVNITGLTTGAELAQKVYNLASTLDAQIQLAANTKSPGHTMQPKPTGTTYIGHGNALGVDGAKLNFLGLGGNYGHIKAGQLDLGDRTINIQAGSEAGTHIPIILYSMTAGRMGVDPLDVTTRPAADASITSVKDAIKFVSDKRTYYGAVQNRMEHSINNLDNTVENTTSAESSIRDTDMAEAMVSLSNENILVQAGQAMIAQANNQNQMVLSLLNQ